MSDAKTEQEVLQILEERQVLRPRDLDQYGIPRKYLNVLYHKGKVERPSRGIYTPLSSPGLAEQTLVEVSKAVPRGIICLLSALAFHGLTTQSPSRVWLAVHHQGPIRRPQLPVRIVRYSSSTFEEGMERHEIGGNDVKVYSPARTIADCFKFRNRIGVDVAIEALKDGLQLRKATIPEIWRFAELCRVAGVIKPYLQALESSA